MNLYIVSSKKLTGTSDKEVYFKANSYYKKHFTHTKRKVYIRSRFFNKEKIFLGYFWQHLWQKNWRDRTRRLKFFVCALELIQSSPLPPKTRVNPNRTFELLHRFSGITKNGEKFYVQIKENTKNKQKILLSVFPE